ncbi:fatty acid amide hydrolase-like [Chiloscyllium plagiosum]|uniref:fatty acid amide hydrolase-like n=1 Tax=Chiloscyllium plagiosum TaxID=36176 RepID=UPI001CB85925|nr:fatty acid amide hydrolase-like [Chiloscyllium plagiosum]
MELAWLLLLLVVFYVAFLYRFTGAWTKAVVREKGKADCSLQYGLKDMPALRLSGLSLKIMAHLSNTIFGQLILIPLIMRITNLTLLRHLVIPEDPVFIPIVVPDGNSEPPRDRTSDSILNEVLQLSMTEERLGFSFNTISDFLEGYKSGKITPTQVATNVISALEDADEAVIPLRAIVQYEGHLIMKMAEASTARYQANEPLSPLDGIPVCLKEEIKVVPFHHRVGTLYLGEERETEDATITRKLRESGAIIIGVSNMHELGLGVTGCNVNRFHGVPRNPYNLRCFTGGSSSGSGAAVASGLCPLAIGTDGGGSIRIPAAFCGVVGLKVTFGRISTIGSYPLSYSTVSLGPICTSVKDAAISYAILAGPDPDYPYGVQQPPVNFHNIGSPDLKNIKIGIDWKFFKDCDTEVLDVCQEAVQYLKGFGATLVDLHIPELEEIKVSHTVCILSEIQQALHLDFNTQYKKMNLDTRATLALASNFSVLDYIQANRQRSRTMQFLKEIFNDVQCIITPAIACIALHSEPSDFVTGCSDFQSMFRTVRYMQLANLTGIPSLVVPVGYSSSRLPISLQIMGKWWDEAILFRVGMKVEQFRTETKKPQIYYDLLQ